MSVRTLSPEARRVLGVLIEKALSQPAYYPMTVNAIVTACNQKNNRDPMMFLDEAVVEEALDLLRPHGLVTRVLPSGTARTDRYKQEATTVYGWDKAQKAVMAELLLRGPQTPGELRSRCERMNSFESIEALDRVIQSLMHADPPFVLTMPRAPGQAATRYRHTFYSADEAAHVSASAEPSAIGPAAAPSIERSHAARAPGIASQEEWHVMKTELAELRAQLAAVRTELDELKRYIM